MCEGPWSLVHYVDSNYEITPLAVMLCGLAGYLLISTVDAAQVTCNECSIQATLGKIHQP